METQIFRHTEGDKLDKSDLQAFNKCAKSFLKVHKYKYLLAAHLNISIQTLYNIQNNKPINAETRGIVKGFIQDSQAAA